MREIEFFEASKHLAMVRHKILSGAKINYQKEYLPALMDFQVSFRAMVEDDASNTGHVFIG